MMTDEVVLIARRWAAWIGVAAFLTVGSILAAEPAATQRATLEVQVWRLTYSRADSPRLDWQPFVDASGPGEPVQVSVASAPPPPRSEPVLNRTPDGYFRRGFSLRHVGEKSLSDAEIQGRIDLFTKVLSEQLDVPQGREGDSGRRFIVKRDRERVVLIDGESNVLKAQVLYDSLFPPLVVTYREERPSPPPDQSAMLIGALKAQHRSPAELESVLNRVSGRTRSSDETRLDGNREDRMPMRVAGDAPSGQVLVTVPRERGTGPTQLAGPPPQARPSRVTGASVSIERPAVPSRERFRRFGRMDFTKLEGALRQLGRLQLLADRTMRIADAHPMSVSAGWGIPYIRYRPASGREEVRSRPAQIRASIHLVPKYLGEDAWQATVVSELVDYMDYPRIEKIYLDFETRLRLGDTVVCKRLVPEEISDDRSIRAEVAAPAETLVFLTLAK